MGNSNRVGTIVDRENLMADDMDVYYQCAIKLGDHYNGRISMNIRTVAKRMTYLMKLVMLTNEHPDLLETISDYCKANPRELSQTNSIGWSPLMLAVANSTTCSTLETVELLLNLGANVNGNRGRHNMRPIILAIHYAGDSSSLETFNLLCSKNDIHYNCYAPGFLIAPVNLMSIAIYNRKPNIYIINHLMTHSRYDDSYNYASQRISCLQRAHLSKQLDNMPQNNPAVHHVIKQFEDTDN
jgi:hypothetical protein